MRLFTESVSVALTRDPEPKDSLVLSGGSIGRVKLVSSLHASGKAVGFKAVGFKAVGLFGVGFKAVGDSHFWSGGSSNGMDRHEHHVLRQAIRH